MEISDVEDDNIQIEQEFQNDDDNLQVCFYNDIEKFII